MTETYDLIVRGGTVIDGRQTPRFAADVGVRNGRIAAVGDLGLARAADEIDAHGLIVAPGFIDSHTHDDQAVIDAPEMTPKISQGVTTVIIGNCGISAAPLAPGAPTPMPLSLLGVPPDRRFGTFADYFAALRAAPPAVNVAALVGHITLRVMAMESLDRAATPAEIAVMRDLADEALAAGAIGVSTGTYYPPASAAPMEEIVAALEPLRRRGGVYVTHMRDEADEVVASLVESFAIGRALGVPVVISHHKVKGAANFGRTAETLALIRETMASQEVGLDCYPYTASSTMIKTTRDLHEAEVVIAESLPHPECVGRSIAEIADDWGVAREEAAHRLQPGSAIYFIMDEDDVRRVLAFPETMIGSDGIPTGEKPHPRLWGTFPRVLGHYSRDEGLLPLETAIWKMTGLTAWRFGLAGRGTLEVGAHADITVFDAATIRDAANYDNPTMPAVGIEAVIVNGSTTWRHGRVAGDRTGQVLIREPV